MLQAAREQTIQKIIYTSSFFALGPTDGHVADESQVLATNTIGFLSPKSDFFPSFFRKKKNTKSVSMLQAHPEKVFCSEYERSKAMADKIALQAAADGVPIVVVYPGVIYGPGKLSTGNIVAQLVRVVAVICHFKSM